jgi:hypothetical protein
MKAAPLGHVTLIDARTARGVAGAACGDAGLDPQTAGLTEYLEDEARDVSVEARLAWVPRAGEFTLI